MQVKQVGRFMAEIMDQVTYDHAEGSFWYKDKQALQYRCKRHSLVRIEDETAPAHRLPFHLLGIDIDGLVVYPLDGNVHNVKARNLVPLPRSIYVRAAFLDRRIKADSEAKYESHRRELLAPYMANVLQNIIERASRLEAKAASG